MFTIKSNFRGAFNATPNDNIRDHPKEKADVRFYFNLIFLELIVVLLFIIYKSRTAINYNKF